jgi:hypothetical protein
MFTEKQLDQIQSLGISPEVIEKQIENFKKGFPFTRLHKPATINDGILRPSTKQLQEWTDSFNKNLPNYKVVKFVPASGAATRMFKDLFEFREKNANSTLNPADYPEVEKFFKKIKKQAFWNQLLAHAKLQGIDIDALFNNKDYNQIISLLLDENGLNYGKLPKGLLKFHRYEENERTSVEEQVVEALNYCCFSKQTHIHFTVSPEHAQLFDYEFKKIIPDYEKKFGAKIHVTYSFQKKSTDTIAVDEANIPVLNNGLLVFRPGGHGALLTNLQDIDADIVFIKNIDNVCPDHFKEPTYTYKKALSGLLAIYRTKIFEILNFIEKTENISDAKQNEITAFVEKELLIHIPKGLKGKSFKDFVYQKLNKPFRICGMVPNQNEKGGGPFWVVGKDNESTLQIVEESQVDKNNPEQKTIFNSSTHFNPVDLVCMLKNYKGKPFNLAQFSDPDTGFISEKTVSGKKIKAQELPGLWNGAMAYWITIFVEVPIETFNPVKTINDLIRKEHQPLE